MERTLSVTITLTSADTFAVTFIDNESGDTAIYNCSDYALPRCQDKMLGAEITSWVNIMRESEGE